MLRLVIFFEFILCLSSIALVQPHLFFVFVARQRFRSLSPAVYCSGGAVISRFAHDHHACLVFIAQNSLSSDVSCKAMTGLHVDAFRALWRIVKPFLADTTSRATSRKRARAASLDGSEQSPDGERALLTDKQVFFATLHFLRVYPAEEVLATQLGVPQLNLRRHLWRGVAALYSALVPMYLSEPPPYDEEHKRWWIDVELDQLQYIPKEPRFNWLRDNDVAFAIDGTEVRIGRPSKDESTRYSAKKKQHSLNLMVLVKLNGDFVMVSDPYDGVPNDQGQWKDLGWRDGMRLCFFFKFLFLIFFRFFSCVCCSPAIFYFSFAHFS
jgi:hypothetical protein